MIVSVPAPPESRMFEERRFLKQNNQTRHSHCVSPRQTQVFPNFTSEHPRTSFLGINKTLPTAILTFITAMV